MRSGEGSINTNLNDRDQNQDHHSDYLVPNDDDLPIDRRVGLYPAPLVLVLYHTWKPVPILVNCPTVLTLFLISYSWIVLRRKTYICQSVSQSVIWHEMIDISLYLVLHRPRPDSLQSPDPSLTHTNHTLSHPLSYPLSWSLVLFLSSFPFSGIVFENLFATCARTV